MNLVECVPNISEGRDRSVIDRVVAAAGEVEGVRVLDVDPGAATNRTVITFAAPAEAALEGAFRLIARAAELIDMRGHTGEHSRNGATDVCPFVPLGETTMDECVELAHALGRRVGDQLGIPVYFYEIAATHPERRNLARIRRGEYEALGKKLGTKKWCPDAGPNEYSERVARTGATQIGAREFLIAYNVNLDTRDAELADEIARRIRHRGGAARRGADGTPIRGPDGEVLREKSGMFEHCKARGWFIEEYRVAQVTINLTNFKVTPMHAVYDAASRIAEELGTAVTGSEIVGLVPLAAMTGAGRHYRSGRGAQAEAPEADLVSEAAAGLRLDDLSPFVPAERIVEYRVAAPH